MNKNLFYCFLFYCFSHFDSSTSSNQLNLNTIVTCSLISVSSTILYQLFVKIYSLINKKKNNYEINALLKKLKNKENQNTEKSSFNNNNYPTERILSNVEISSEIKWNEVFLPQNIKDELLQYAKSVFQSKNNYEIIIPNILLLYGLPGSNKTAIIKGLANELNIPLLIIDPNLLNENIYNKISIETILDNVKNKGMCIVHIKNIERMSKNFLISWTKYLKTGFNHPNILLTFSCNNDFLIKDLCLNKNKYIKFMIIDTPKYRERFQLIEYIFSLYKNFINIDNVDINHLANLFSSCKQKDIYLILEKAIEKKQSIYINENNNPENSFDYQLNEKLFLNTNDIILEYKFFKKQETIIAGENDSQLNFGLNTVNEIIIENPKITFDDVIGLEHIKKELKFIADYFKNPESYKKIGIRMPKGILFKGPPGCGKTLMARAIAGEAGITVISINGSDFIHKYVGQGAKKVREVFDIARIEGPSIIFVDEIDAIGAKRSDSAEGGEKEYTQTQNALLTEMDGFSSTNNNVIVIASTNRNIESLDPALMRRFEEKYNFPLPTYKDRLKILQLYFKDITLEENISLESIAIKTNSFSGADLEHLVNQSKYIAINRMNRMNQSLKDFKITEDDIIQSYNTISIGYEILNHSISEEAFFKTAVHESGHTLCMLLQKNYPKQFELVTISPRDAGDGTILGFAQHFNKEEFSNYSKENLEQLIIVSLGGQVAEEIILGESYDGVTSDLHHATNIAKAMVTKYGMSDNLYFNNSEKLSEIEQEAVEKILKKCKEECKKLLIENKGLLEILSKKLLIQKTLKREEVLAIIELNGEINSIQLT